MNWLEDWAPPKISICTLYNFAHGLWEMAETTTDDMNSSNIVIICRYCSAHKTWDSTSTLQRH